MSIARHHNDWLRLVPNSGPFLSLPVLTQAFPQGLDGHDAEHARRLRIAFDEWDEDPGLHRAWSVFVLGQTLGYDELLAEGQAIPQTLKSHVAEYGETLRPDWIVNDPTTKKPRLLVQVYPRSQSLTKPVAASRWKTSPDTRMMQLLHDTGIRLGIVTNGDHWMLVNAPKNETTGYASWYANLWLEEKDTLRALRTLLGADRLFSVPDGETLEALLDKSANDQQEVTDQLGYQVRKAVEVLIQSLDKADQDHGRKLLGSVNEKVLYESALTVMMRLVFLFCAEERDLLLLGDELFDKNYAVSTLREQLRIAADQFGEEILGLRFDAWVRLLTTFRAVYAGIRHDRLKLPAYGGSLFNPDRFPFLEGRKSYTSWKDTDATPLPVSNRTVLHLLEALQMLQTKVGGTTEARTVSFRWLNIEQIGHVYEGLLDHTAKRATEPMVGLAGTRDKEPEIALSALEKIVATGGCEPAENKTLLKFLKDETGRSESAIKKALNAELDDQLASRFRTACQNADLWKRVKPFAGLIRLDTVGYPVVIRPGSVFVTAGTDRRSSGTHYTPKSLTEPIVQYTLEPLVFEGPPEGWPKEQWRLRSAKELLALKVCDMACGSGAFLVQACRYLSERVLEAWDAAETSHPGVPGITPEGAAATGKPEEQLIPADQNERQIYAMRIVAQRCLYGVDKNPLAVEMAKLSLWLLTLAKGLPFEFLDHAIRCGDSLVGIHNLEQLERFNLKAGSGATVPIGNVALPYLSERIRNAIALRRRIGEMRADTVEDAEEQERLLGEANEKIDRLKCAADLLISAEFAPGSANDKLIARDNSAIKVAVHFPNDDLAAFRNVVRVALGGQTPFHWPLEFPEVMVERGGFDAFVGNPPFMGGKIISGSLGQEYRNYISATIAGARKGNADLCSFFFLVAADLIAPRGQIGLLATKTLAQGETRQVCLGYLLTSGFVVTQAVKSRKWPGDANLAVSHIWLRKQPWCGQYILDDSIVNGISASLEPIGEVKGEPQRLACNRHQAFQGSNIRGIGFAMSAAEAGGIIRNCDKNRDVLFPFLSGNDILSDPARLPQRWVINFFDWSEDKASQYSEPFSIAKERVLPERQKINDPRKRKYLAENFWQYDSQAKELYKAVSSMERFLVHPFTSKYHVFDFCRHGITLGHTVTAVVHDTWSMYCLLQSDIHCWWALEFGNKLETRPQYSPWDCFETFPFPVPLTDILGAIGEAQYLHRSNVLKERYVGLTAIYNLFHDSQQTSADIQKLRELHVEMDSAVAAAYGWNDLDLGHGFHETKQGVRYTISEAARREVLARLLKLNHERYAEEVKQGLHDKKKPKGKKGKTSSGGTQDLPFQAEDDLS